jgi:hypothetical protein
MNNSVFHKAIPYYDIIADAYPARMLNSEHFNEHWKPAVRVNFNCVITKTMVDIIVEWCHKNCKGGFIIPKTWWIEFEFFEDWFLFKKTFDIRKPTTPKSIVPLNHYQVFYEKKEEHFSSYEEEFFWSNIYDWCNANCKDEWFIDSKKRIANYWQNNFCFNSIDDALRFKLRWL